MVVPTFFPHGASYTSGIGESIFEFNGPSSYNILGIPIDISSKLSNILYVEIISWMDLSTMQPTSSLLSCGVKQNDTYTFNNGCFYIVCNKSIGGFPTPIPENTDLSNVKFILKIFSTIL